VLSDDAMIAAQRFLHFKFDRAHSPSAILSRANFSSRSEFRLGILLSGRFVAESVLIFFSLLCRFFLDIDVS